MCPLLRRIAILSILLMALSGGILAAPFYIQNFAQAGNNYDFTNFVSANVFTVGEPTSVTGLRFWMADRAQSGVLDGAADNFSGVLSWAIYSDVSSLPGTILFSGTDLAPAVVSTGLLSGTGREIFQVDAVFSPSPLLGAGNYWLALLEGMWGGNPDGTTVAWQEAAAPGFRAVSSNITNPSFALSSGAGAFELYGSAEIPEPSTFALIGLGLSIVWLRRRV